MDAQARARAAHEEAQAANSRASLGMMSSIVKRWQMGGLIRCISGWKGSMVLEKATSQAGNAMAALQGPHPGQQQADLVAVQAMLAQSQAATSMRAVQGVLRRWAASQLLRVVTSWQRNQVLHSMSQASRQHTTNALQNAKVQAGMRMHVCSLQISR